MKITTIGYGTTRNIGNYENCKVYLEAEVNEGENVDEVLSALRHQADAYAHQHKEVQRLETKKNRLSDDIETYMRKIRSANTAFKRLRQQWEKTTAFLEHHGIKIVDEFPHNPSLYLMTEKLLGETDTENTEKGGEVLDDIPFNDEPDNESDEPDIDPERLAAYEDMLLHGRQ
ncbi:hypothetical protein Cri9333_1735 [Crinalium epipsammum PCC 9333]|uniref:Uncharacterized protein n=1 Tax=Crinalium epipsammum PCC 9333 TaxID=1173022 RepID=K9VZN9_9CYAN|nr:hypothetical protein [Crinalium epipsammum]AFZ12620.1 hypothetical protein Cri9333_1735 [Crinalium epipsammum PCC 9333]